MSDVITSVLTIFVSSIGQLLRILIGAAIVIAGITIVYYWATSKKKIPDMGQVTFKKQFEASKRLGCGTKKKLVICPVPLTIEDARRLPYYQINYQPIGDIVGINMLGIFTNLKDMPKKDLKPKTEEQTLEKKPEGEPTTQEKITPEELTKILNSDPQPQYAEFWFAFAYERQTSWIPLFSTKKQALLLAKGNQIISSNSRDDIIRIRGFGLYPLGAYEIIEDENFKINVNQQFLDQVEIISKEVTLSTWGSLTEIVTHSISADPGFRKLTGLEGIKVQDKPTVTEGQLG